MSINKKELEIKLDEQIKELEVLKVAVKDMVTPKIIIAIGDEKVQYVEGIGYADISIVEFDLDKKKKFDVIHIQPKEINQISQEQYDFNILGINEL